MGTDQEYIKMICSLVKCSRRQQGVEVGSVPLQHHRCNSALEPRQGKNSAMDLLHTVSSHPLSLT